MRLYVFAECGVKSTEQLMNYCTSDELFSEMTITGSTGDVSLHLKVGKTQTEILDRISNGADETILTPFKSSSQDIFAENISQSSAHYLCERLRGNLIQLAGSAGSGKTRTALKLCAEYFNHDPAACILFIDTDGGLDQQHLPDKQNLHSNNQFQIIRITSRQSLWDFFKNLDMLNQKISVIVLDSISFLMAFSPRSELESCYLKLWSICKSRNVGAIVTSSIFLPDQVWSRHYSSIRVNLIRDKSHQLSVAKAPH